VPAAEVAGEPAVEHASADLEQETGAAGCTTTLRVIRDNRPLPLVTRWPSCGDAARSGGDSDALSPIAELLSGELATALVTPGASGLATLIHAATGMQVADAYQASGLGPIEGPGRIPRRTGPGSEVGAVSQGGPALGAGDTLTDGHQYGALVTCGGRVPGISRPPGEVAAGGQGVRVSRVQRPPKKGSSAA
jgi:hypothetical protein